MPPHVPDRYLATSRGKEGGAPKEVKWGALPVTLRGVAGDAMLMPKPFKLSLQLLILKLDLPELHSSRTASLVGQTLRGIRHKIVPVSSHH